MSRRFHNLARDDGFWRSRCLQESSFLEAFDRRRRLLKSADQATGPHTLPPYLNGSGAIANNVDTVGLDGGNDVTDGDGDRYTPMLSPVHGTTDSRERERVRIMANWDPCFPSERVSWYSEYVQRNGPVAVNWMQNAYDEAAGPSSSTADLIEARGVALYYPDGDSGEAVLAVSPLDDGGVCLWDVGGTRGRRGAIVARSRPGILFIDGPEADNQRRSKRIDSGVTECVSVDSWKHRAFFAVQSRKCKGNLVISEV